MDLEGRITFTGNEPHARLTLITDEGAYYLEGPEDILDELARNYQQRVVKFRGTVLRESPGPGLPGVFEVESFTPSTE